MTTRRLGVLTLLLSAVTALAPALGNPATTAAAPPPATSPDRPNIVLIVADDLGHGDVAAWGGDIATPSIDALAGSGVRFTAGYVTAPVCNPSRAGLMTGRYQQRWGQEENEQTTPPEGSPRGSLPQSETTLGAALAKLGYHTGAIGKWHLGMQPGYHPMDRGFDEFFGMASGTKYVDRSWPNVHFFDGLGQFDPSLPPLDEGALEDSPRRGLFRAREPAKLEEYVTEQLTREALGFIDRNQSNPFFLYLAYNAPHAPLETTDVYYQRFAQFKDERKRVYASMISALDDGVGRVLAKLHDAGLDQRTLVVFVSDNGAAEYVDADGKRNAPFFGHKRNLYEGGIRLPYAMRWPGRLPAGKTYAPMVSTLDLMPTLLAAAGALPGASDATAAGGGAAAANGATTGNAASTTSGFGIAGAGAEAGRAAAAGATAAAGGAAAGVPALDGVDLLPFLTGTRSDAPHDILFWRTGDNGAVRRGDWKLLIARRADNGEAIERLYDLASDPGETRDLSREKKSIVEELRAAWTKWNAGLAAPRQSARTVLTEHEGDSIRWQI